MKKLFTLFAIAAMAMSASAEEAETYAPDGTTPTDKTVTLTNITAAFLDNTSKGSTANAGTWTFGGSDVRGDQNGLEIKFTPTKSGELKITFAAKVAGNKSVNMVVNGDAANTMDATLSDGTVIKHGIKLEEHSPAIAEIAADDYVTYKISANNVYNFYVGGTKWRLRNFSFTPDPTTAITDINVDDANAPVEYFNLQGIRVENPQNGLYVRRQGSKVEKVYVK